MHGIQTDRSESEFNKICAGAYKYPGKNICAYNMAMSLVETHRHLKKNIGPNSADWQWSKVHYNDYPNMPWSMTPLKPIFHRSVPAAGSGNTVAVSRYSLLSVEQTGKFPSHGVAMLKLAYALGPEPHKNEGWHNIDTGMDGNYFAGSYFNANEDFYNGKLHPVLTGAQIA